MAGYSIGSLIGYIRIGGAAQAEKDLLAVQRSMSLTGASADRAAAGISATDAALVGAGRAANVGATGTAKYRQATLQAFASSERMNRVLGDQTASTETLARAEATLIGRLERVRALLREQTMADMGKQAVVAETAVTGLGGAFGSTLHMAKGLGLMLGGFELAKKGVEWVKAGKDLTDSLNMVQATSHATNDQMVAVREQVIGLGKDMTLPAATAVDAADALNELVKAGFALPRALQATRPALLLAAATQTDMANTARVLGDSMDIWSLQGADAAHAANILGAATLGASHNLVGLFNAIKQAGPSAQALHIDLDNTAAALVYLAKHGSSTSVGGAGLKVFFQTLVKDAPKSIAALKDLGVNAFDAQNGFIGFPKLFDQLHASMIRFGGNTKQFMRDLSAAFGTRAVTVAELFAKGTGKAYDEVLAKLESGDVQKYAELMNRGVSASFRQLNKEGTALGIDLYAHLAPAISGIVSGIGHALPVAVGLAGAAFAPFIETFKFLSNLLPPMHSMLSGIGTVLGPIAPIAGAVASSVGSMWLAFQGYKLARAAVLAITDAAVLFGEKVQRAFNTTAIGAWRQNMQADAAAVKADVAALVAAETQAAAEYEANFAAEAQAQADRVAADSTATDEMIANAQARADALQAEADAAAVAAAEAQGVAEETAVVVNASGDAAKVGWMGILGPLALVGVGILSLITLFHKSSSASKEAADAAKAYTDALSNTDPKAGSNGSEVIDAIKNQLTDNHVPELIDELNKGLHRAAFSGQEFVAALRDGGKPLTDLQTKLQAVIKLGTILPKGYHGYSGGQVRPSFTPAAQAAMDALKHLNDQNAGMVKAQREEISAWAALGTVAAPIDKVAASLHLSSAAAAEYAGMLGLAVTKNNDLLDATAANQAAIKNLAAEYSGATPALRGYLDAWNTFAKSGQTIADRGALIGSTLKAANGDMLGWLTTMNAGSVAGHQFAADIRQAAAAVGKHGESTKQYLQGVLKMKNGTLDYTNTALAPLLSDMAQMQTTAMSAASAQYTLNAAHLGGKRAADLAYTTYKSLTTDALQGMLTKLTGNKEEAKKLANQLFGMPKNVKSMIEMQGTNPALRILDQIGKQLSVLTKVPWVSMFDAHTKPAKDKIDMLSHHWEATKMNMQATYPDLTIGGDAMTKLQQINAWYDLLHDKTVAINIVTHSGHINANGVLDGPGFASGTGRGGLPQGFAAVGEEGPELAYTHGGKTEIFSNAESKRIIRETGMRVPGFAKGTTPAQKAAKAAAKAAKKAVDTASQDASSALSGVNVSIFLPTTSALQQFLGAMRTAANAVEAAIQAGVGKKAIAGFDRQLRHLVQVANNQLGQLKLHINNADMGAFRASLAKTAQDVATAYGTLMTDLADAGVSQATRNHIGANERSLMGYANERDRERAALAQTQTDRANLASTVSSAVTGSYDVTKAGTGPSGNDPVTAGSMRAQQLQAASMIRKWAAGIRKLGSGIFGKSKAGHNYLSQLASAGPSTLPQVDALLSMGNAGLRSFIATETEIENAGASTGAFVGNAVYGQRIKAIQARITLDNNHINKLSSQIGKEVHKALAGMHFELHIDSKGLAKVVLKGENQRRAAK